MTKLTVNEVKHVDKLQEALEELKKPKFRTVGEYGKYIKSLKAPSYEQKSIIVYSVLDMIEANKVAMGEMTTEKLVAIMSDIAKEVDIQVQELLKILVHLLSDVTYLVKIAKQFKELFIGMRH